MRNFFDIIVCDEAHNIPVFPTYSPQPNFASIARDNLCYIAEHTNTFVIGITATPEPLTKLACAKYFVPIDTDALRQYEVHETRTYASLPQVLEQIPSDKIGMLYVPCITQMKECAEIASAAGHKPICVQPLKYLQQIKELYIGYGKQVDNTDVIKHLNNLEIFSF